MKKESFQKTFFLFHFFLVQFHYGREHEEDFGRRENVEREAAIERSRRKRRTANQVFLSVFIVNYSLAEKLVL